MTSHKAFMILSTAVFHPLSAVPRAGQGRGPLPLWFLNPASLKSESEKVDFLERDTGFLQNIFPV